MNYLFVLFLTLNHESVAFSRTEIYKPLFRTLVAVTTDGGLYILDQKAKKVLHYDPTGKRKQDISGPGQGPGELGSPGRILFFEDHLYIFDNRRVHLFDPNGVFVSTKQRPPDLVSFQPVIKGWIGFSGLLPEQINNPSSLIFLDAGGNETVLYTWDSENRRYPREKESMDYISVNPADDFSQITVNKQRNRVAIYLSGTQSVYVFDLVNHKLVHTIEVTTAPLPFDRNWGDEMLRIYKEKLSGYRIKENYPSYFPKIQNINYSAGDHLIVSKWRVPKVGEDINKSILVFNNQGKQIEASSAELLGARMVAIQDGHAFLIVFSEGEEWSIRKLPISKAIEYTNENPLPDLNQNSF